MQECLGVSIAPGSMEQLVERMSSHGVAPGNGPYMVFTANLDHVVKLRSDDQFRSAYRKASVVTADGMPVYAYARMRGANISRIPGSDLFVKLMGRLDPDRHRCFFVLSSADLGQAMVANLASRGFARDRLGYAAPRFGFDRDAAACEALAESIAQFRPTHLFMCVGSPKSEIWCDRYAGHIGDAYVLCCGASVEFFLGAKRRAPVFMRKTGLEWFWRWAQEPGRLSHRYFVESWGFLSAIRDDLWGREQKRQ
jgi:N-acetylglucosaminyldiphosphoundecaprenol N-acetyl-beta-D-mannosaminyltransferase